MPAKELLNVLFGERQKRRLASWHQAPLDLQLAFAQQLKTFAFSAAS